MGENEMNKFVNPYNFIPLEGERAKYAGIKENEQLFTGEISYSVLIKSPLFIPSTKSEIEVIKFMDKRTGKEKEFKHRKYSFFSYGDGKPIIPGSEIRGMLRGNFEILTNSCLSSLESDMQLSKRTSEPFKKGLIRSDGNRYLLYEADSDKCRPAETKAFGEATKIWYFRKNGFASNISMEKGRRDCCGYLIKGYFGGRKEWHHAFYLTDETKPKEVALDVLDKVLGEYKRIGKHTYEEYANALNMFRAGNGEDYFPVYYSEVGETIYLSPACFTREIYGNTLKTCAGTYKPCESQEDMCPTCALFGMLAGNGENVTSRIRFSDLTSNKYCYGKEVTLKELLSPRLNNMEFYLKRPSEDAVFWTYDYYIRKDGTLVFGTPELNGRKFYWHNLNIKEADYVAWKRKLNVTVTPIKSGRFSGKLYFKDVSESELRQIVWLLNAGEYETIASKKHGYKLGAAKPLGFGSVAISVDEILCRQVSADEGKVSVEYVSLTDEDLIHPTGCFSEKTEASFRKATAFNTVEGMDVSYPYEQSKKENGYTWFVANHKAYVNGEIKKFPNSRSQMIFLNHLKAMEPKVQETLTDEKLKSEDNG